MAENDTSCFQGDNSWRKTTIHERYQPGKNGDVRCIFTFEPRIIHFEKAVMIKTRK
jgi:hypothetical protein